MRLETEGLDVAQPFHESYWAAVAGVSPALMIANTLIWERLIRAQVGWPGLLGSKPAVITVTSLATAFGLVLPALGIEESLEALSKGSDAAGLVASSSIGEVTLHMVLGALVTVAGPLWSGIGEMRASIATSNSSRDDEQA